MPHVRRSMLITVDADTERVRRALVDDLALAPTAARLRRPDRRHAGHHRGSRSGGPVIHRPHRPTCASMRSATSWCRSSPGSSASRPGWGRDARSPTPPPASRPRWPGRRPPPPVKPLPVVPPVPFTPEQAGRLGALAAVALLANFCGALLSQNGDAVTSAFDQSDQALGVALAVARAGVLVSLVAIALADRWGRRRLILARAGRRLRGERTDRARADVRGVHGYPTAQPGAGQHRAHRRRHRRGRGRARRAHARSRPGCSRSRSAPGSGSRWSCSPSPTSGTTAGASPSRLSAAARAPGPAHRPSPQGDAPVCPSGAQEHNTPALPRAGRLAPTASASSCSGSPRSSPTCSARRRRSSRTDTSPTRTTSRTPTSRCSARSPPGVPGIVGVVLASRLAESRGRRPVTIIGLLVATGVAGRVLPRRKRPPALDHPGDRDHRRRVRGAGPRDARRRAVPDRGPRHVERLPPGLRGRRLRRRPGGRHPAHATWWAGWVPPSPSAASRRCSPRSSWSRGSPRRPNVTSTTSARPRCEERRAQLEVHVDA